jgi:predicted RND superfamily exporter protein
LERTVRFYAERARLVLTIATVVTVIAAAIAVQLRLDADLERLLPESAPSVQGLEQLEESYGIIGRVNIVLMGEQADDLRAAAEEAGEIAAKVDGVERVEVRRPNEFFQEHRLLYIEYEDLEEVSGRIEKRLKYEKKQANPLFVDVGDSEPPEVDLSDIEEKYDEFQQGDYYCKEDGTMCVVFVFPEFSAGDLQRSEELLSTLRSRVSDGLQADHPGVDVGLSGRYAKRVQQQRAVNQDLARATGIALIALFLFLLIYFRGLLAALWVFIPLVMGTVWAFAWAEIVFGSLNVLTGFFGAVLLGLGIDYGIHILSRYLEALESEEPLDAMVTTLSSAGRASMYAGLTTVIAFGSLMTSSFRAFFEYGVIALGGMALIIIANVTILPCILLVVANSRWQPKTTMSVHVAQKLTDAEGHSSKVWRALLIGGLVLVLLLGGLGLPNTAFEYDFRNVQTTDLESWRLDEHVDKILGTSQLPVVVLAEDAEHAERVAEELRRRTAELPEGRTMSETLTLADIIPDRQQEKLEILAELHEDFDGLPDSVVKKNEELEEFWDEIRRIREEGAVAAEDLPENIRAPFERRDDPDKKVVLGFPTTKQHDVKEMEELAVVIRDLPGPDEGTTIDGINDSLLLVDIFESVKRDAAWMIAITLVGLLLTALLAFRDPRRVALLLATIGTAIFVAIGAVGLWGIKFNFINIVVIPIWLGLGVDAAFHLMVRHEESPGEIDGFLATALAVGAAFVTSMIGFGAMLVTSHKGLSSMGAIAVIGLGSILVTSLVIQSLVLIRHLNSK